MTNKSQVLVSFSIEEKPGGRKVVKATFDQIRAAKDFESKLVAYPDLHPASWDCLGVVWFDYPGPEMAQQLKDEAENVAVLYPPPNQNYPPSAYTV